jgi:hypothetical protein
MHAALACMRSLVGLADRALKFPEYEAVHLPAPAPSDGLPGARLRALRPHLLLNDGHELEATQAACSAVTAVTHSQPTTE